jgi:hypothetical protein
VLQETGLRSSVLEVLETIGCWFSHRSSRLHKFVVFCHMACEGGDVARSDPAEVDAAVSAPMKEAVARISFDNERGMLRKAKEAWRQLARG